MPIPGGCRASFDIFGPCDDPVFGDHTGVRGDVMATQAVQSRDRCGAVIAEMPVGAASTANVVRPVTGTTRYGIVAAKEARLAVTPKMLGTRPALPNRANHTKLFLFARDSVAEHMLLESRSLEDHTISDRQGTERLLRGLYAARVSGDIAGLYDKFSPDARFQIAGAGQATPVAVTAMGAKEYRPLLAIMVKTFKLSDQEILSLLIDGAKAAVHWRAKIFSRLTGTTVVTELVDMIEIRDGRIGSYIEFFAPH